ncbi:hypothetical protein SAMN05421796_101429 [Chryseobacterium piscicola]|uniref:Uncharacterized protein n=1 Tax=Chryseobacterium piscicola TaxID=551459 RepID=A0A1N7KB09_9FLAO|nr:hypothetical protein [Chryseobacterium piscicola]PQA96404.1 hypothetical protein B0A70_04615 [Chryseobacterium piscicola]SIS58781.1 hypothetical protein SAMN05421796_101429 [Chryseobacterium piscicola]
MKNNLQAAQGVLSIVALLCIVAGWFHIFPENINQFLSKRIFYVLVGISFILQAPFVGNKNFIYPMYAAAALCIIGAFLPYDSLYNYIKTIGLLAGIIISFSNRSYQGR